MTEDTTTEAWLDWADEPIETAPLGPRDVLLAGQRGLTTATPIVLLLGLLAMAQGGDFTPLHALLIGGSLGAFVEAPLALAERWVVTRRFAVRAQPLDLALLGLILLGLAALGFALSLGNLKFMLSFGGASVPALDFNDVDRFLYLVLGVGVPWASASWLRLLGRRAPLQGLGLLAGAWLLIAARQVLVAGGYGLGFAIRDLVAWTLFTALLLGGHGLIGLMFRVTILSNRRVAALRPHRDQAQVLALLGDPDAKSLTGETALTLSLGDWARRLHLLCPAPVRAKSLEAIERALETGDSPACQLVLERMAADDEASFANALIPAAWALGDVATVRELISAPLRDWAQAELPPELKR